MSHDERNIIHAYGRGQAIDDGVLVDVSETAREAGFVYPVALTCGAWERCVSVPEDVKGSQDETGRLWDVLSLLRFAVKTGDGGPHLRYSVGVRNSHKGGGHELVSLHAVCGPDDDGSPCITVMLEGED